jgi:hypothetical protein
MPTPITLDALRAYAEQYAGCDSCNADVEIVDYGGGVYVANVMHDDWCPSSGET